VNAAPPSWDDATIAADLGRLLDLNARSFLHYLLQAHPRPGDLPVDRQARLRQLLAELVEAEDRLALEVLEFARQRHLHLTPGDFPLPYLAHNYLVLEPGLRTLATIAGHEVEQLAELKQRYRAHPDLGPLTASLLSARRGLLRRVTRLVD
jgi:hypothetical protein